MKLSTIHPVGCSLEQLPQTLLLHSLHSLFLQFPEAQMMLALSMGTLPMVSLVGVLEQLVASMAVEISRPESSPAPPYAGVAWFLVISDFRYFISFSASSSLAFTCLLLVTNSCPSDHCSLYHVSSEIASFAFFSESEILAF